PGFWKCYPANYEEFLKPFKALSYNYDCNVVNLKKYGVPQNRSRYLFLASKDYPIKLPPITHGKGLLPYVTVKDAIKKYPQLRAGSESSKIPNHTCYKLTSVTLQRLKNTPKNGGSRSSWPSELVLKCHQSQKGHSDVYGRMRWNDVAPTLTCRCISVSNGRFAHPTQNRGISVREAAALQTFSDDFIFLEPKSLAAKHIGNAVPPLSSKVIAMQIIQTVKCNSQILVPA
ncbi:MAG: DNA cytosine methyltransferase, partial [Candidatus Bathyarchaeia archaeon]